jgi:hypothetical protein
MSDLDSRCEKCERDIEQLWGAVAEVIKLVKRVLAQVDEVFGNLRAQTDAGFARLRASIDAASRTERKDDEPPKLN